MVPTDYEPIAKAFMAARDRSIGADVVRAWSTHLPRGARVLDVGCGHGVPITAVLVDEGFTVSAVEASPTLAAACATRFPGMSIERADLRTCLALDDTYDGVVMWGVMFLLSPSDQRDVLRRLTGAVAPGGRLLFTSPREELQWADALSDQPSWSIGYDAYAAALISYGLELQATPEDAGGNFYYCARRPLANPPC